MHYGAREREKVAFHYKHEAVLAERSQGYGFDLYLTLLR